jgi:hypothetical protein
LTRLTAQQLLRLDKEVPGRERGLLATAERLRLLQSDQVRRLFFADAPTDSAAARACRRALAHLTKEGLLFPLERRVGGIRAGSSGQVYAVTASGRRALAFWSGDSDRVSDRGVHEPGPLFVAHTLAIAEVYVRLVEADREGSVELIAFDAEPACWRALTTVTGATAVLKPDAFVRMGAGEFEQRSFLEVDLATHGRGALVRKMRSYLDYYRSGREQAEHGVFPRVVWSSPTATRAQRLADLIEKLSPESARIQTAVSESETLPALVGEQPTEEAKGPRR